MKKNKMAIVITVILICTISFILRNKKNIEDSVAHQTTAIEHNGNQWLKTNILPENMKNEDLEDPYGIFSE